MRRAPRTEPLGTLAFQGWAEEAEPTEEAEQAQLEPEGSKGGETFRERAEGADKWGKSIHRMERPGQSRGKDGGRG